METKGKKINTRYAQIGKFKLFAVVVLFLHFCFIDYFF